MPDETTSIRTSFLVASLLSALWLAVSAWLFFGQGALPPGPQMLTAIATAFAPVAAFYALAAALGPRPPAPQEPLLAFATSAEPDSDTFNSAPQDETQLQEAEQRLLSLRAALAAETAGLQAVNETLTLQAQSITALVGELGAAGVQAMEAGQVLDSLLPRATLITTGLQKALNEAAITTEAEAGKAEQAAQSLTAELSKLTQQAEAATIALTEARAASETGSRAIRGEADALFETLEHTHVAKRDAVARQGEAMVQQLHTAYARLESLATAATGQLSERLAAIDEQATGLEGRLQANMSLTESLLVSGERAFKLLEARLAHSNETNQGALERLSERVHEVGQTLAQLTQPIRDTKASASELDTAVGGLKETALQVVDLLGKAIPEQAHIAGHATVTVAEDVQKLMTEINAVHRAAEALHEPLAQQRKMLDDAGAACTTQQQASEIAGAALVAELQQAKLLLGEVETRIHDASLSSASGLVETMSRLREVISQTGGSMRDALDSVLAEARESLSATASEAMRKSFAEPVARHAREAEETAAKAAERTANSMAALADVLKLIEGQVAERTVGLEQARQADLLATASLLTDQLAEASVSISSALGRPMDDDDWVQWRKGERTLFHRRALSLLDRHETKELRSLLETNAELAQTARDYSAGFDALVRRIDLQTPGLASALQGSDQGRLAAALAEALGD